MGGGNGMKSKTKRERQQKKDGAKGNNSQLVKNKQAMNIVCKVCRQSFMCTLSEKSLAEHVSSKHPNSGLKDCFTHLA